MNRIGIPGWCFLVLVIAGGGGHGGFPGMSKERVIHIVWVRPGHGTGETYTRDPDKTVTYHGEELHIKQSEK